MTEVVARHVHVSGRVQGVWFRQTCRREAERLGVSGWVRNSHDGRVEAWFEGAPASVDRMVGWCHDGPPRAAVTRVEAVLVPARGLHRFEVR
jgi:acylphosphatase